MVSIKVIKKISTIRLSNMPRHIAIIMDGNARWAKLNKKPTAEGHRVGATALKKILVALADSKVEYLTVYAFSSENWARPADEVDSLMKLMEEYLTNEIGNIKDNGIKLHFIGDKNKLNDNTKELIDKCEKETKNCVAMTLNIALSYGSRNEIIRAVNSAIKKGKKIKDESSIKEFLDTELQPDPDLLIRTGGEKRLSNFLLWQLAYTELYFTKILWPDFNKKHLIAAINVYNKRERKYGKRTANDR